MTQIFNIEIISFLVAISIFYLTYNDEMRKYMAHDSTVQTLRIIFISSLIFTLTVHYLIYT